MGERLCGYVDAVEAAAARLSLVSHGDKSKLLDHVADSLSLMGGLRGLDIGRWLDIGSGAGFPAIPMAILLPDVEFILVERRARRCAFLHMVKNRLTLDNVELVEGAFPRDAPARADILSARAVEKPMELAPAIREYLIRNTVFLCQNDDLADFFRDMFHVEQIVDNWSDAGLRRGALYRIQPSERTDVPRGTLD